MTTTPAEPTPTSAPPAPPAPKTDAKADTTSGTTRLRLAAPAYCTAYQVPREGSDTLRFDRNGTEVPASDAETLIEQAASHGVRLEEVSE